jgi:Cd2+/Zn2+-exporting ATPase
VKSGARIPLDSVVTSGKSSVNQAPITGESMPVDKKAGDILYAGTINGEGSLEAKVSKAAGDSMLARIIKLVGESQAQKAPSQRFVDAFARYYTPAVMVAALLVWLVPPLLAGGDWGVWFYRALVLLVIACPCALVISTPVSIVSGLTAMARRGVLIKGGAHLEALGKLRALALDKTGTLTTGQPKVLRVITMNGKTEGEILRIAAAIDTHSGHPLARAVLSAAEEQQVAIARGTSYLARTGRGAEAHLDGHEYFVGNHRFNHELGTCSPEIEKMLGEIEKQGQSVVIVGHKPHANCAGEVLGILAIGDPIRPHAKEALQALHAAGIEKVVMLSGDNQNAANAIAAQTGIDEARGDLLPDDKIQCVRELTARFQHVGMIGDGVNDAPAMAAATVGIAMGLAGTDTAIETADMTLMQDDLGKVAEAIHLGRRTLHIIQFNIAFALGLKLLFLALALAGYASLWLAILADTGATLLVILNALRLLRGEDPKKEVGFSNPTPAIS